MLYYLRQLKDLFGPFRLFGYLSFRSIGAVVTAFVVALVLGPVLIHLLKRQGARDKGRDFGGLNVISKEGTPTMGGLLILASLFAASLLWCDLGSQHVRIVLAAALYFGAIGALDDVLKIQRGSNERGLSRHWKYASQIAFGALVGVLFITPSFSPYDPAVARTLTVPIWKHGVYLGWGYMGLVVVFMVLSSNSVNIADGLDGLAIVPAMLVAAVLGVFAYVVGTGDVADLLRFGHLPGSAELTVFCCALIGAGAGFLWFNSHPASIFMGDTGSLALGGILGTLALLTKQEVVFFIAGGIFVVEAGSSFIQDYIGLKLLGRRLFFRAPYHHSLMHQGYSETKVTARFWILSVIFAAVALATLKLR
ncbi:MAG: phospho-N-acetylmuramoyl-pentapeptide-transferase [bacterium]